MFPFGLLSPSPTPLYNLLVWTPCLMHRCVCIWRYIIQNYNYKLHFQNLSTYHIPHVSIMTLASENFDVCTACDSWDSNIQLTMGKHRRRLLPPHLDLYLEVFVPKTKKEIAAAGGWGVTKYLQRDWMDDGTDGWKKFHNHDILYYM